MRLSRLVPPRTLLFFLLGPLLCLISSISGMYPSDPRASRMLGIVLWTATWWATEVLPLAATALLPFILQPLLGILSSNAAASAYLNDAAFLFLGSFILAQAVEKWGLHRKVALVILHRVGTEPKRLLLGFLVAASFLSMWISNTGTSVMMVPMACGVLDALREAVGDVNVEGKEEALIEEGILVDGAKEKEEGGKEHEEEGKENEADGDKDTIVEEDEEPGAEVEEEVLGLLEQESEEDNLGIELMDGAGMMGEDGFQMAVGRRRRRRRRRRGYSSKLGNSNALKGNTKSLAIELYSRGVVLGICYACSIGGLATLTGTGPNIILSGFWSELHPEARQISFLNWILFGFPLASVFVFLLWLIFAHYYARGMRNEKLNTASLEEEIKNMRPMEWPEKVIVVDFALTVLLWLTRSTQVGGWGDLFPIATAPKDGSVSALSALVLFMIPARDGKKGSRVLDWETAKQLPWDIVLILGAGFSMSQGIQTSGLLGWMGKNLSFLGRIPLWLVPTGIAVIVTIVTEFTSNVATSTIMIPVLNGIAKTASVPFQLMLLPATLACSLAFMLPNATPPNAVAYSSGYFSVPQMMRPGLILNIIGVGLISVVTLSLAPPIFGFSLRHLNDSE